MALKLVLEKIDGLDDAQKALYVERDGKFHLDVDGIEDTSGLKSALEKERAARREFEKKYVALKDVDPEEYAKLKKEAEDREQKKLEDQGEFEKLREKWAQKEKQMQADHEAKLKEKDALLQKLVLEDRMRSAALKAGVVPGDIDDVLLLTGKHFQLDDDGNVRVLDESGEATTDTPATFFEKTFKERKPKFYQGSTASGGGATPGGGGRPGTQDFGKLSPVERLTAARKAGMK